jgi:4-hydroxy-tetrahydrodipicolinate reductase
MGVPDVANSDTKPTMGVTVSGATGWAGRAVAEGVLRAPDLHLVGAVARSAAGRELGQAWGADPVGLTVAGQVDDALADADILVDYTAPAAAKQHALLAIQRRVHVVIGTSGLSAEDFDEIHHVARAAGIGVVAAGNFSLTAAMAQAGALLAAHFLPQREIIDYASAGKPDAPSGTARELAERLATVSMHEHVVPVHETIGHPEARGAQIAGTPVHSLRLPSFVVSTEVVFAQPDERLSIRHDAGSSPAPYVAGTLLAIRAVRRIVGVVRGLDTLLVGR